MAVNMPQTYGFDDSQRVGNTQCGTLGESTCKVDMVLAHDVVNAQGILNSFHVTFLQSLRKTIVHAHLLFAQFKINHAAGAETAMSCASMCTNSPNALTNGHFFTIFLSTMSMASWFLINKQFSHI